MAFNQERWHLAKMTWSRKSAWVKLKGNNAAWDSGRAASSRAAGRLPYEPESKQTHCQVALLLLQGGSLIAVWIISSFVVVKECVDARHCEETNLNYLCVQKKAWEYIYIPALLWDCYSKHNINHYVKIKIPLVSAMYLTSKHKFNKLSRIGNTWCSSRASRISHLYCS